MADSIVIESLELSAHIGISDEERGIAQRLTAHIVLRPNRQFYSLNEDIANAVDYSKVALAVQGAASSSPRRLIETLAEDVAALILRLFPLESVSVEIRKYVLPDTGYVSVKVDRSSAR